MSIKATIEVEMSTADYDHMVDELETFRNVIGDAGVMQVVSYTVVDEFGSLVFRGESGRTIHSDINGEVTTMKHAKK
jgi:hypothetical protein